MDLKPKPEESQPIASDEDVVLARSAISAGFETLEARADAERKAVLETLLARSDADVAAFEHLSRLLGSD